MYVKGYSEIRKTDYKLCCGGLIHNFVSNSRYLKKEYNCNGTIVEHSQYGEVMQLTGDQRQQIKEFVCKVFLSPLFRWYIWVFMYFLFQVGIVKEENCKIHGF